MSLSLFLCLIPPLSHNEYDQQYERPGLPYPISNPTCPMKHEVMIPCIMIPSASSLRAATRSLLHPPSRSIAQPIPWIAQALFQRRAVSFVVIHHKFAICLSFFMLVYTVSKGKKLHSISFSFSPQNTIIIYPNTGNWKKETPGM